MSELLHHLITATAERSPEADAVRDDRGTVSYRELDTQVSDFASALVALGLGRGERVGIYLEKRLETVVAAFATSAAGAVFVPINPLLKNDQVGYILHDCNVRVLVTSPARFAILRDTLAGCPDLRHVVLTDSVNDKSPYAELANTSVRSWTEALSGATGNPHRTIDTDLVAILYTSGSTGRPKGVMLSHRNLVAGAKSVASYLENRANDVLLAALPLSFDAGFSQLTTAFLVGAKVVLINYLMASDVINAVVRQRVTGLTAVPPLWIQVAQQRWPPSVTHHLRYVANTGGRIPLQTLKALRAQLPETKPYLMYGLTEAFRATYLPPEEVDRRPDSIGRAIPNAEVLVLRPDGSLCSANEPGELVQRGALVAQGYWNDAEKTAERFKPLPVGSACRQTGLVLPEIAVFSGDTVRRDEEGFLYFIGRRDEMIKTSGYRVSPTEVEEVMYATRLVGECVAFAVEHATLGQAICLIATPRSQGSLDPSALLDACRPRMPAYMVPSAIEVQAGPLPKNANGKIDRLALATAFRERARQCDDGCP